MNLTLDYHNKEVAEKAMDLLSSSDEAFGCYAIKGYEPELLGEKLVDVIGKSEIYRLEEKLSRWFDYNVDFPKDIKFIEEI